MGRGSGEMFDPRTLEIIEKMELLVAEIMKNIAMMEEIAGGNFRNSVDLTGLREHLFKIVEYELLPITENFC